MCWKQPLGKDWSLIQLTRRLASWLSYSLFVICRAVLWPASHVLRVCSPQNRCNAGFQIYASEQCLSPPALTEEARFSDVFSGDIAAADAILAISRCLGADDAPPCIMGANCDSVYSMVST